MLSKSVAIYPASLEIAECNYMVMLGQITINFVVAIWFKIDYAQEIPKKLSKIVIYNCDLPTFKFRHYFKEVLCLFSSSYYEIQEKF